MAPGLQVTPCAQYKALGCPQCANCPGGSRGRLPWAGASGVWHKAFLDRCFAKIQNHSMRSQTGLKLSRNSLLLAAAACVCVWGGGGDRDRGSFLSSISRDPLPVLQRPRPPGLHKPLACWCFPNGKRNLAVWEYLHVLGY